MRRDLWFLADPISSYRASWLLDFALLKAFLIGLAEGLAPLRR
jgi:hypothetical protein